MDLHQNCDAASTTNMGSNDDVPHKQKWNTVSLDADVIKGCLDCNICLDTSQDPVVTLCGHLYCWPCIYKWLQVQSPSQQWAEQPKCPVCKEYISTSSLVPLYSQATSKCEIERHHLDSTIPQRPPAPRLSTLSSGAAPSRVSHLTRENLQQPGATHAQHYLSHPLTSGTTAAGVYSPTITMVSEMIFATMFRGSNMNSLAYSYPSSYHMPGSHGSPRLRRQEIQAEESLNRMCIFLFCCIIWCLLLF